MARHYSTKDFFRQMPNALLARYFEAQGLFGHLDFAAMKEGKPDALFGDWLYLSEEQRNAVDAEFRDIFELSCEKGCRAFIEEARWQMRECPERLVAFIKTLCPRCPTTTTARWSLSLTMPNAGRGRPASTTPIT